MKIMTPADITRLRGDAPTETHLARYDRANEAGARRVLLVSCPFCGAAIDKVCATRDCR
jgi:hypothetical protein